MEGRPRAEAQAAALRRKSPASDTRDGSERRDLLQGNFDFGAQARHGHRPRRQSARAKIRDASEKIQLEVDQGKLAPAKAIRHTVRLLTEALRDIRLRQVDEIFAPHETEGLIRRFLKSMMKWVARRSPGLFLALHGEIKDELAESSEGLLKVLRDNVRLAAAGGPFSTASFVFNNPALDLTVQIGQTRARGQTVVATNVGFEFPGRPSGVCEFQLDFTVPPARLQTQIDGGVARFKQKFGLTDEQFARLESVLRKAFARDRFSDQK
jgi:hypothetical protein